jgi:hypothetical protein
LGHARSQRKTESAGGIAQVFSCRALRLMLIVTVEKTNALGLAERKGKSTRRIALIFGYICDLFTRFLVKQIPLRYKDKGVVHSTCTKTLHAMSNSHDVSVNHEV